MKYLIIAGTVLLGLPAAAQALPGKIAASLRVLENSKEWQHAIVGLLVADAATGKPVYAHNAEYGLAPASTQKLFTSIAALETLGPSFRYETLFGLSGDRLVVDASGDPSLGSPRFTSTRAESLLTTLGAILKRQQQKFTRVELCNRQLLSNNSIPGGWIWEDIGNYYGAPAHSFNWMENQFDIVLHSGSVVGDSVAISGFEPPEAGIPIRNTVTSAPAGTGDNTIVYLPLGSAPALINGSIPVNEKKFVVSAAMTEPLSVFLRQLLPARGIPPIDTTRAGVEYQLLYRHVSPTLDSLNYWFLRKSINLYGEALLNTLAAKNQLAGETRAGTEWLKKFWAEKGIDSSSLHIYDGSGLSPQNRVTVSALVKALQFAKGRPWFSAFYNALPEYNGMKMKSGSINGARAFAGFHKTASGKDYVFAVIVNNYDGASITTVRKLFGLLDLLK
ncbi:MAG: D-alanyl-D-alanine carboxypeptidase/D-alanyl-D-alanine-endopeptidase [Bacteroidota bacterium]|nr:D-alanyl-D-alanine carboxypeptidase/D-alanyl-D-alanine-endopeptidase [Bacteroidota bacterium]